jgi:hypothetical protein
MRGGLLTHSGRAGDNRPSACSVASVIIPGASGSPWIAFGSRSVESWSALNPIGPGRPLS